MTGNENATVGIDGRGDRLEIFWVDADMVADEAMDYDETGYYYWYAFPGCMPEGDACGAFATLKEAYEDAATYDDDLLDFDALMA